MTVTVLYFAALRDLVGRGDETLALPPAVTTVAALSRHLCATIAGLAERMDHVRIARNEAFAAPEDALHEGDIIALLPPVAGG